MTDKTEPTATQLFSRYMLAIDKVRTLTAKLLDETKKADSLADELGNKHGIFLQGRTPANTTTPVSEELTGETEPGDGFKPPAQGHSDAPRLAGSGSRSVEEIRRGAGLHVEAGDSEALAVDGMEHMAALQKAMGGAPIVVPTHRVSDTQEDSPAGNGLVEQKPRE